MVTLEGLQVAAHRILLLIFIMVLGFELRAYTLSHSTSHLFIYLVNYFPGLSLNLNPLDLCLLSI
jgi:hypothetical protein